MQKYNFNQTFNAKRFRKETNIQPKNPLKRVLEQYANSVKQEQKNLKQNGKVSPSSLKLKKHILIVAVIVTVKKCLHSYGCTST